MLYSLVDVRFGVIMLLFIICRNGLVSIMIDVIVVVNSVKSRLVSVFVVSIGISSIIVIFVDRCESVVYVSFRNSKLSIIFSCMWNWNCVCY